LPWAHRRLIARPHRPVCADEDAGVLRGFAATWLLIDVDSGDPQELMARLTGNYKHGNEQTAKKHPRNRRR
jgi:hypothetical protein